MVVINNEDFGESMELIHCIKKAVCKLTDKLSEAEMGYRHREEDDEYDEEDEDFDDGLDDDDNNDFDESADDFDDDDDK